MANEEQLSILKQGVDLWNEWRAKNPYVDIDLNEIDLSYVDLRGADLNRANLNGTNLTGADLREAYLARTDLSEADLSTASLDRANLMRADLDGTIFWRANLSEADLSKTNLSQANLSGANLKQADLSGAYLTGSNFSNTVVGHTIFRDLDLSEVIALETVEHLGPSSISTDTFALSEGKIPEIFLQGCGLSDWEIEMVKLYNPAFSNEKINNIQYKIYDLRSTQSIQIFPLFISYSHADSEFVDKIGNYLTETGIRYWRDIHNLKAGRMEKQIDQAIRQNSTLLLILSKHSIQSDWVEHEVRKARGLEKEMGRDVLCPIALDDSWKSSPWPERIMEQIMEYNILDFSVWEDNRKFERTFNKLINGLGLFYKG